MPKSDLDGVYNSPQLNRPEIAYNGVGALRVPAAHTQQKLFQVIPRGHTVRVTVNGRKIFKQVK